MKKTQINIISQKERRASLTMLVPFDGVFSVNRQPVPQEILDAVFAATADTITDEQIAIRSQFFDTEVRVDNKGPNFNSVTDVIPNEETDYIYPLFRAISASIIPDYWVEYPADVLKAAVPLLEGRTVYKNHDRFDVEKWIGSVNNSVWDAEGAQSENVPGINAELKIDLKVAPLIARGILMKPPAVDCVSVTVVFTFDYSHPDIEKENHWKFIDLLGEEVGGEIVRFIATKILDFYEISPVYRGADRLAKGIEPDGETDDESEFSATRSQAKPVPAPASQTAPVAATALKEKPTVKLTEEQKKRFGLETHAGDDVPEDMVLQAAEKLASQADAGRVLLDRERAECLRLAGLAEGGTDGTCPEAISEIIQHAPAEQLVKLTTLYSGKAAERYKQTCQKCGSTNLAQRSSVETVPAESEQQQHSAPTVGNSLH